MTGLSPQIVPNPNSDEGRFVKRVQRPPSQGLFEFELEPQWFTRWQAVVGVERKGLGDCAQRLDGLGRPDLFPQRIPLFFEQRFIVIKQLAQDARVIQRRISVID